MSRLSFPRKRESRFIFAFFFLFPTAVIAGGPISISASGTPAKWDVPIPLDVEAGACADFTNAEMLDKLDEDLARWTDVTGVTLSYAISQSIDVDVNVDNYTDYLVLMSSDPGLTDGLNPIMFDNDGEITDDLFGSGSNTNVLGFAGPDSYATADFLIISGGQAVFNCFCIPDQDGSGGCPGYALEDLDFTMTHELGHLTGMDHTQANQDQIPLAGGQFDCDLDVLGDCGDVPAMFPVSVDPADQMTITRDDEVSLLTLYGLSSLQTDNCTVTGTLLDTDGNPLRCADVWAETDDHADTIAVVSGVTAPNEDLDGDVLTDGDGECLSNCGDFILRGLDSSKNYTITVKPIDSSWTGGSGIYPCDPQLDGITEEQIDSFSAGACAAGATRALGNVSTVSTGGLTDDDDGSTSSSSAGCSLRRNDL